MTVAGTNFGKAAADYGRYRAGFPDSLFVRLAELAQLLAERFPVPVLAVPHRVFAIIATAPVPQVT